MPLPQQEIMRMLKDASLTSREVDRREICLTLLAQVHPNHECLLSPMLKRAMEDDPRLFLQHAEWFVRLCGDRSSSATCCNKVDTEQFKPHLMGFDGELGDPDRTTARLVLEDELVGR